MTADDEPNRDPESREEPPLVPRWLLLAAVASVIASFTGAGILAYVEPCPFDFFSDDCDTRFNWGIFLVLGGIWSLFIGFVTLCAVAFRNTLRYWP